MRKLGQDLGVEAMALYYHFANKDEVIDGIVDLVFAEIHLPVAGAPWKSEMRRRAISVRDTLLRHRWAIGLMEARAHPGPANLRHHDAVIGNLRAAGFDIADGRARLLGPRRLHLRLRPDEDEPAVRGGDDMVAEMAQTMLEPFPFDEFPNLAAFVTEHIMQPGYDFGDEFEYGLDLILDGLERALTTV